MRLVHRGDDAERDADAVQDRAPFRQISRGKNLVEDHHQFPSILFARLGRCEARIVGQILAADRGEERTQLPLLVEQRHDEPAAIAGLIVIRQRIRRVLARRAMRHLLPNSRVCTRSRSPTARSATATTAPRRPARSSPAGTAQ